MHPSSLDRLRQFAIRTVARTPLVKGLLVERIVREQVRLNSATQSSAIPKTPWVFDRDYDLEGRVAYIESVVAEYFQEPGIPMETIANATILEIGPGESLGVALKLLGLGARRVVCVDRFDSMLPPKLQNAIYDKLVSRMTSEEKAKVEGVVRIEGDEIHLDEERLSYVSCSLDELDRMVPPETFDITLSRAVLEHVYQIDKALEVLDLVLKPGGLSIHEIDFRDHGIFSGRHLHPLTMFTIPPEVWHRMGSHTGAPNRRTLSYFRDFFERSGYTVQTAVTRFFGSEDQYRRRAIADTPEESKRIGEWVLENASLIKVPVQDGDLLVAAAFVVARKERTTTSKGS